MSTDVIVAIISAIAAIFAAIIGAIALIVVNRKRNKSNNPSIPKTNRQEADVDGNDNIVEQSSSASEQSQIAKVKGDGNSVRQVRRRDLS